MNDDLAAALEAAAKNASALEALCDANEDEDGATQANVAYVQLSTSAEVANAKQAMRVLAATEDAQRVLTDVAGQMDEVTRRLAQSEANVATFVAVGTAAANLATALRSVPPNVGAGLSAVSAIAKHLGIG